MSGSLALTRGPRGERRVPAELIANIRHQFGPFRPHSVAVAAKPLACNVSWRFDVRSAVDDIALALARDASWNATAAFAAVRSALACETFASKVRESIVANTSPDFTSLLKSTDSLSTCPDNWEPIDTVTSARTGPDVETSLRIGPLLTRAVS